MPFDSDAFWRSVARSTAGAPPSLDRRLDALEAKLDALCPCDIPALPVVELPLRQMRVADLALSAGYRCPVVRPRCLDPAPRTGLRAVGYLGNTLALRAPETHWRRLAWAWIRGAMLRLWKRSRIVWIVDVEHELPVAYAGQMGWRKMGESNDAARGVPKATGTHSGGPR